MHLTIEQYNQQSQKLQNQLDEASKFLNEFRLVISELRQSVVRAKKIIPQAVLTKNKTICFREYTNTEWYKLRAMAKNCHHPISVLQLDARTYNCILNFAWNSVDLEKSAELYPIQDLLGEHLLQIMRMKNFGRKSLHCLISELEHHLGGECGTNS